MKRKRVLNVWNNWNEERTKEDFEKVKNFFEMLKVDYTSELITSREKQFVFGCDDYEYMLILQVLRLSDLNFDFE